MTNDRVWVPWAGDYEVKKYDTSIKIRAEDLISDFPSMRSKPTPDRIYVLRDGNWIRLEDDFGFGIFGVGEDPEFQRQPMSWDCPGGWSKPGDRMRFAFGVIHQVRRPTGTRMQVVDENSSPDLIVTAKCDQDTDGDGDCDQCFRTGKCTQKSAG